MSYVKNNVWLFFATTALSSKMIQLSMTTIWTDFSQYIYFIFINKYMVFKICLLKYRYVEQCMCIEVC